MIDPTELTPERIADQALVSAAIKASGLSASAFAREILVRNPRAIFRMLAGEVPLSPVVRAKCRGVIERAEEDKEWAKVPPDPLTITDGAGDDYIRYYLRQRKANTSTD